MGRFVRCGRFGGCPDGGGASQVGGRGVTDRTITFESTGGFELRRSDAGTLTFVNRLGYVLGFEPEDLRWMIEVGGPAMLVADDARRRIDGEAGE